MTIIESIRKYIKTYPGLKEFENTVKVNVDKLEKDVTVYSIDETVCNPILKKFVDGSSERQFLFVFASREFYGQDVFQNIDNIGFYDKLSEWLEDNTRRGILPQLEDGKQALSIKAISNGYAFNTDETLARYQIQIQLKYYQKQEMIKHEKSNEI
ncbi:MULTISPECIES: chloramphenicol resistance protein [unclassified Clostridium]|uniref:chloramphenicol resistance protein n=1 Tax=unclassified Clostridium TaxID=2614128 RepID=UPI0013FCDF8D|nr:MULTISPECIES: chloramphenicol resistance protein [unclassified Clostridium]NFR85810.1 chloramphenicol resistance protein [Clostridium botulinum]NFR91444.1 chloramphenicol resistance protein [Clostridium botulinum]NFU00125.1 chloramphenicol resistance protein [Clostridium botulinum]